MPTSSFSNDHDRPLSREDSAPTDLVRREDHDGVSWLTLNRPGRYNALNEALLERLQVHLDAIAADSRVLVVVLRGAGQAFCAGHDLKEMRKESSYDAHLALFERCTQIMMRLTRLPQPVIAAVTGIATAAGCQLVAQCDLAIAEETARFATSGIGLGLFCATPSVPLVRSVGRKKALEMLFCGDFIGAPEALQYGLLNAVVPPGDLERAAEALARKIAAKSPTAIAIGKDQFYRQIERPLDEAYRIAARAMAENMLHPDAQEGIDAFIAKRPTPSWRPREEKVSVRDGERANETPGKTH